jgi:hypothetical protein
MMPVKEVGAYHVGQRGWFDVLERPGNRRYWVKGEILSLIPTSNNTVWAMIKTWKGIRLCRLW